MSFLINFGKIMSPSSFCASSAKFFYKTRISVTKETNQKLDSTDVFLPIYSRNILVKLYVLKFNSEL